MLGPVGERDWTLVLNLPRLPLCPWICTLPPPGFCFGLYKTSIDTPGVLSWCFLPAPVRIEKALNLDAAATPGCSRVVQPAVLVTVQDQRRCTPPLPQAPCELQGTVGLRGIHSRGLRKAWGWTHQGRANGTWGDETTVEKWGGCQGLSRDRVPRRRLR